MSGKLVSSKSAKMLRHYQMMEYKDVMLNYGDDIKERPGLTFIPGRLNPFRF